MTVLNLKNSNCCNLNEELYFALVDMQVPQCVVVGIVVDIVEYILEQVMHERKQMCEVGVAVVWMFYFLMISLICCDY
jgi:hypothetical protein